MRFRRGAPPQQGSAAEGEERRPQVHDQHRAPVGVPELEQPVMQVQPVGVERRVTRADPADDRHAHVHERQDEDEDRQQDRQERRELLARRQGVRLRLARDHDGRRGDGQADEHRARVAHEDARRVEVEAQERQQHTDQAGRDHRHRRLADPQRDEQEARGYSPSSRWYTALSNAISFLELAEKSGVRSKHQKLSWMDNARRGCDHDRREKTP